MATKKLKVPSKKVSKASVKASTVKRAKNVSGIVRAKKTNKRADEACCFWVNNGPIVSTLPDLAKAIRAMNDEQFAYHTKRNGNDFAHWVRDVFGYRECATLLEAATTRAGMIRTLVSCNK